MFVSGSGNGAAIVLNIVLVQRGAPDRLRGRAFTVLMGVTYAAMGVGLIVAGPLTDAAGPRWVFVGSAACIAVAAATASILLRGERLDEDEGAVVPEAA
jgi:MFS family permease